MELDRAKLDATLRLNSLGCLWCGHQDWAAAVEPTMMIRNQGLVLGAEIPMIAMFPVKCNGCGLVYWFDGQTMAKD